MGNPGKESGTIEAPIGPPPAGSQKMMRWLELEKRPPGPHPLAAGGTAGATTRLMRFKLDTGRTHQIRVGTAAHLWGHPILGDAHLRPAAAKCRSPSLPKSPACACAWGSTIRSAAKRAAWFEAPLPPDLRKSCLAELRPGLIQSATMLLLPLLGAAGRRFVSRLEKIGHGDGGEHAKPIGSKQGVVLCSVQRLSR